MLLETLQADFAAALFDVNRVPGILQTLADDGPREFDRIALYRGNLRAGWEKALAHAYPVVRALVGEEFFRGLAHAYGRRYPSMSGDLNRFGASFPTFVSAFEQVRSLPYLSDVAELEWYVHAARYTADVKHLERSRIAALSPHDLLAARFALNPACAWLRSVFPVVSMWRAHLQHQAGPFPDALDRSEWALIVRPRWHPEVLISSAGEIAALVQLKSGREMDAAIEAALHAEPGFDISKALVRWLDRGVIVDPPRSAAAG